MTLHSIAETVHNWNIFSTFFKFLLLHFTIEPDDDDVEHICLITDEGVFVAFLLECLN